MSGAILMFAAVACSLVLIFVFALGFKAWRKRDARRSPFKDRLHHTPGQQLIDRIAKHDEELSFALLTMYLAGPFMLMAWALVRVPAERIRWEPNDWMFAVAALAIFGFGFRAFMKHWDGRQNARDGLAAERMTAQQLNRLVRAGCIVLHDVPGDGFNIDHVVISPSNVYAVETKSRRKPRSSADDSHYRVGFDGQSLSFPGWKTSQPIEQARMQAQWLARRLRESLEMEVRVVPTVALPGWFIDPLNGGHRSDVRVFTPMGRGAAFMTDPPARYSPSERTLIAQALALRYPESTDS